MLTFIYQLEFRWFIYYNYYLLGIYSILDTPFLTSALTWFEVAKYKVHREIIVRKHSEDDQNAPDCSLEHLDHPKYNPHINQEGQQMWLAIRQHGDMYFRINERYISKLYAGIKLH